MLSKFKSVWIKVKVDCLIRNHKPEGREKTSRFKARESFGMRRTYHYAAMTKNEVQRRPSALLRAVSPSTLLRTVSLSNGLSNGRWTFYEAVKARFPENMTPQYLGE